MIDLPAPNVTRITVDLGEAHNLSIDVLRYFESQDIEGGVGAVSLVLSTGRILFPDEMMKEEDELRFVQSVMDFVGTYFAAGGVN